MSHRAWPRIVLIAGMAMVAVMGAACPKVVHNTPASLPAFADPDCARLAQASLLKFNQAVTRRDFNVFYRSVARYWQDQTTPSSLMESFQEFIDHQIDIGAIRNLGPVWDLPPAVEQEQVLVLTGHYESEPSQVAFELKYMPEKGVWKLIAIAVRVYPPERMVPFDSVLGRMARETMLDFNQAVTSKSFVDFYQHISTVWQGQITPEKLQDVFQVFIDHNVDLSDIANLDPDIEEGAHIGDDGVLIFKGSFATPPDTVGFELKYVLESGQWKLLGIYVTVS